MTRQIKFRGKRKDNNEWVSGYYVKHLTHTKGIGRRSTDEDYQHLILSSGWADWNMPNPLDMHEVHPETVGQYTEINDKDGKEIYEGDIVILTNSLSNKLQSYVIVFSNGIYWACNELGYDIENSEVEIIDNIHNNPELLEGGEG